MSLRRLLLFVLSIFVLASARAGEFGSFPSRSWDIRQIRLGDEYPNPPFVSIVQSKEGLIYAGDQSGVIEFDGLRWRRLPLPLRNAVTMLGVTRSGALVVGGAESLLVVPDPRHAEQFIDVNREIPNELHGSNDFWEFAEDDAQWCARSVRRLVCRSAAGFRVFRTNQREFGRLFQTSQGILIQIADLGVYRVTLDGPELLPGGEAFAADSITTMVEPEPGIYTVVTNLPHSLWRWNNGHAPTRIAALDSNMVSRQIGIGLLASPNRLALPEENGGVAILDLQGELVDRIDPSELGVGVGAQAVVIDREGALWVAWRSALSRIEYPSRMRVVPLPSTLFGQSLTLLRTRLGITSFSAGAILSLGQSDVTGRWELRPSGPDFQPIISIRTLADEDFVATTKGLWSLHRPWQALEQDVVFTVAPALGRTDTAWVGLRNGVARIERNESSWQETERNAKISFDTQFVHQVDARTLWLGSMVGRVARVHLGEDGTLVNAQIGEFGPNEGLPRATISIEDVNGEMQFLAIGDGFYEFRDGRFEPSRSIPKSETGDVFEFEAIDDSQILLGVGKNRLRALRRDITGIYRHQASFFDQIAFDEKIRSLHVDADRTVWLSQDSRIVRIDPTLDIPNPKSQQVVIRDVSLGEQSLIKDVNGATRLRVNEGSGLRVEYTLPSYRAPESNRFRSRIGPHHAQAEWSNWSNETRRDFTNLPAGELLFEVEAKDAVGGSGGIASFPLTVVAPWYHRDWATLVFVAAGLLLVWLGVQWRVRALRARGAELERLVAIKTDALQAAANTDPLTGLWNRHRFGQWLRQEAVEATELAAAARPDEPVDVIVCVVDLDHFKRINDQHGHAAGDQVLKAVADRLQSMRRRDDWVFRFGGEEFVYLGTRRHLYEGKPLAEAIVHEIAQIHVELEGGVLLEPTASVGWSVYPFYRQRPDLFSLDFVLGVADRALYLAKEEGRNRACGFIAHLPVDDIDRTQADWRTQAFTRHPDFLERV